MQYMDTRRSVGTRYIPQMLVNPNMNTVLKRSIFTAIVLVVFGILLWFRIGAGGASQETPGAETSGEAGRGISVEGFVVRPEQFHETVYTTGNIMADEEIYVRSESSGRVTGIYFEEDSEVREGDLMLTLNVAELQQEKRRITFQINLAEIREQRQKELLERTAIAQDDYDVALNELNTLKAQRDRVQAQIDDKQIRAPFDGVVGLKEISVGSYISPETVITSLQKIDPVKVEFSIPERFQASVSRGQNVRFRVEGDENYKEGEIYAIQPRVDRETRSLRMRAIAPNPDFRILPGAFARVEVDLSVIEDALLIPSEALIPEITGYKVFVYSNGNVTERNVQIGTRTDRQVMIREGLNPQDTVITTGLLQLRDNMAVHLDGTTDELSAL